MKILVVLTSHNQLGNTGNPTGFWLEELAAPYYVFKDAGAELTLASPKGGQPPLDPNSAGPDAQTGATRRFDNDEAAKAQLANTVPLAEVTLADYDAVFYPGGHGPLWDLTEDKYSIRLLQQAFEQQLPVGAVCHAPAVFAKVKNSEGEPVIKSRTVTGFTNSEEAAVGLSEVVPFLLEDKLQELGATYQRQEDWQAYVVTDGNLVTGQNPASSAPAAEALLQVLDS